MKKLLNLIAEKVVGIKLRQNKINNNNNNNNNIEMNGHISTCNIVTSFEGPLMLAAPGGQLLKIIPITLVRS
jgi:hypothetical protein